MKLPDELPEVIVCDACLRASCWQGINMCSDARRAGTAGKTVSELTALNLESPIYWSPTNGNP